LRSRNFGGETGTHARRPAADYDGFARVITDTGATRGGAFVVT